MNKERNTNLNNAIVVFDGNVEASKLNELFADFQGDIVINGNLIWGSGDLRIKCSNLYINDLEIYGKLIVEGNLYVQGNINCCDIVVNGSIVCLGYMDSMEINVAEDLYVKKDIEVNGYDINVGGEFVCDSEVTSAAEITVLNKMQVFGCVEADKICVG